MNTLPPPLDAKRALSNPKAQKNSNRHDFYLPNRYRYFA